MTLWFDVSDLCIWTEPQLTGIQRTVLGVLTELMRLRNDVRLFRCHSRRLSAVDQSALPWIWTDEGPLRTAAQEFSPPWDQHVGRLVRRFAGEHITALLGSARNVSARLRAPPASVSPLTRYQGARPVPLFAPGDCCVSLSATWPFPNYAEIIAGQKSLASISCINLIYDLIPSLFPQWAGAYHARRFTSWVRGQIDNADLILAISDFQKAEIERFIAASGLPSKPIATLRLGDDIRRNDNRVPAAPPYTPKEPFVLCVSTIDARKNQSCLHQVWRRLAVELGADCPQLLLIGMTHRSGSKALRAIRNDPSVNKLIVHLPDVSDAELAWYFANCLFTVYPSFYEGWGLPVRESLAAGRYCISSNASSLPEAGGDLVDYFDPADETDCFDLVHRAIVQRAYIEQREWEIRARFRAQCWHATALHISDLANEVRKKQPTDATSTQSRRDAIALVR